MAKPKIRPSLPSRGEPFGKVTVARWIGTTSIVKTRSQERYCDSYLRCTERPASTPARVQRVREPAGSSGGEPPQQRLVGEAESRSL